MLNKIVLILCAIFWSEVHKPFQYNEPNYAHTLSLFLKSENILERHRQNQIKKRIYSEPISEYNFWVITFRKHSLELFNNVGVHRKNLLHMLQDNMLKKGENFNDDIVKLLYNQCIDEYANTINILYPLFLKKKITKQTFKSFIVQDAAFCNNVAKNYQNEKLRYTLKEIYKAIKDTDSALAVEIDMLLSGKSWRDIGYEMSIYQPPILKIKCP